MPRFSVVVTVRNDEFDLRELLAALEAQTRAPEEVVVVDGGSIDGTLDVLRGWRPERFPVRVLVEPGSNIAQGRNAGIRAAQSEWIACTDAGCRPDPGWLDALAAGAAHAEIVAGIFVAEGESPFERAVALTHYPTRDELGSPSLAVRLSHRLFGRDFRGYQAGGRSMAFSKAAWEAVGGYPDLQYAGEDLAFSAAVIDSGFRSVLAPAAAIRWRPPATWSDTAKMFFTYCRGDVRSPPRGRHGLRLVVWTLGPALVIRGGWRAAALIGAGALAYMWLPLQRARQAGFPLRHRWMIPAAIAVKDVSQLAGAAAGLGDVIKGVEQPNPQPPPRTQDASSLAAQSAWRAT
jgi:cellulose synthase/poly-beta-1,6-N-acetylglucosamine synthase-like glycosyltransferase